MVMRVFLAMTRARNLELQKLRHMKLRVSAAAADMGHKSKIVRDFSPIMELIPHGTRPR